MDIKQFIQKYHTNYFKVSSNNHRDSQRLSIFLLVANSLQVGSLIISVSEKDLTESELTKSLMLYLQYARVFPLIREDLGANGLFSLVTIILVINLFFIAANFYSTLQNEEMEKNVNDNSAEYKSRFTSTFIRTFSKLYHWVLLIPTLEMSFSLAFKSFRELNEEGITAIAGLVISIGSLLLIFFNNLMIFYFWNTYDFLSSNTLRSRFSSINVWRLIFNFFLQLFTSSEWNFKIGLTHVLVHFYQILRLFDYFRHPYYVEPIISLTFMRVLMAINFNNIFFTVWVSTGFIGVADLSIMWLVCVLLAIYVSKPLFDKFILKLVACSWENSSDLRKFIIGLEELVYLAENSKESKESFMRVCGYFKTHRISCKFRDCFICRKFDHNKIFSEHRKINNESLLELVDECFQEKLNQKKKGTDFAFFETFLLKYFSFLIKYRQNYFKSAYSICIESHLLKNNQSYFFKVASSHYYQIGKDNLRPKKNSLSPKDIAEYETLLQFNLFVQGEQIKEKFKDRLLSIIDLKIKYWEQLTDGFESVGDLMKACSKIIKKSNSLEASLKFQMHKAPDNVVFIKLYSMFLGKILGDPLLANKLDKKVREIRKRDSYKDPASIHSVSIMKGNVTTIIVSFLEEFGKILSYSENLPNFFGYSNAEFASIRSINSLLPDIIKIHHDNLIRRLLYSGKPVVLGRYRNAFARSKNGFLFPIKIFVNMYLSANQDFTFSSLFLKVTNSSK